MGVAEGEVGPVGERELAVGVEAVGDVVCPVVEGRVRRLDGVGERGCRQLAQHLHLGVAEASADLGDPLAPVRCGVGLWEAPGDDQIVVSGQDDIAGGDGELDRRGRVGVADEIAEAPEFVAVEPRQQGEAVAESVRVAVWVGDQSVAGDAACSCLRAWTKRRAASSVVFVSFFIVASSSSAICSVS